MSVNNINNDILNLLIIKMIGQDV